MVDLYTGLANKYNGEARPRLASVLKTQQQNAELIKSYNVFARKDSQAETQQENVEPV